MANWNDRPQPPRAGGVRGGIDWSRPRAQVALMYALGIAAFTALVFGDGLIDWVGTGFGVAALAIAASRKDLPPSWAASHHEFGLRTLIIAGCAWMLLALSKILIITIPFAALAQIGVGLWLLARSVVGLVRGLDERPIERPETLLV